MVRITVGLLIAMAAFGQIPKPGGGGGGGSSGPGTGTVTSVTCGSGLTGGVITAIGTCAVVNPLNQNTSGTAANLSGTPALPNGTTATTQTVGDNSAKVATDAFVLANAGSGGATIPSTTNVLIGSGTGNGADSGHPNTTGAFVGTTDTQTLTNKTVDGVTPTTFGFLDPTSSVQTQLNAKAPIASPTFTGTVTIPSGAALATPTTLVGTNITGTASGLTSGITNALKSATTTVDVSAAAAPAMGSVLTATDSTHATWQASAGGGTVTVVGAGSLASTDCVTGGGTTTIQTPSVNCTVDSSGNLTANTVNATNGVKAGSSAPALTSGTGGSMASAEGTAPSVGPAAAVDVFYSDATQHGFLANFNNAGYLPLVQGPASDTSGHVATWSGTNGGKLVDGGALPTVTGGTCTNQVVTAISGSAVPTCTTLTSAYVNNSIALTGTDINTSNQVTATHLASALPVAQGGTGATSGTVTFTISSGTSALGTSAIASAACATVVTTSATGVASTDAIQWTPNASIKAVTGYTPATTGGLSIAAYPTANNVNFDVCNWSSGSLTPGAVTLNWRVVR